MTRPNAIEMKPRSAPENGAFVPPSSSRIAGTEPAPMKTSSPVPMDRLDLRRSGLELAGVDGADSATERSPVEAAELDAVARAERSLGADDAHGEQAPAVADDRAAGAVVHVDAAADALAEAEPELERRLAGGGGLEARAERLPRQDRRQHAVTRP